MANIFDEIFNKDIPLDVLDVIGLGDSDGNRLTVVIQDSSTDNNKKFGSNSSRLNAINCLIDSMDFKFEYENDQYCFEKRMVSIIDTIGKRIKYNSLSRSDKPNIVLVKEFIEEFIDNNLYTHPEFINILDNEEEEEEA